MTRNAAIIGGGVIGSGWAARFLLNGWNVRLFDPGPNAEAALDAVLSNARTALPSLYDAPLPPEGTLTLCQTLTHTVSGAHWVQESVPERLDIKHDVLDAIRKDAPDSAIIASSTSGFRPSQLNETAGDDRVIVAHPFNPVYLVPVVELVGVETVTASAARILTAIGMKPLMVKKEIDAHIGDRLLEAVWREALWLIKDGVATTQDIDDVIRYGFGLRWAQMGLFETYRIAGGEAGMAHFLAQFGPALKWPWTKLMDVPDLDDSLIATISAQSDAQSGHHSIREMERIRDRNLVAIMRALAVHDWGAGALVNARNRTLRADNDP